MISVSNNIIYVNIYRLINIDFNKEVYIYTLPFKRKQGLDIFTLNLILKKTDIGIRKHMGNSLNITITFIYIEINDPPRCACKAEAWWVLLVRS